MISTTANCSVIDIEKAIIGACLSDANLLPGLVNRIKPNYFEIRSMRILWENIVEMFGQGLTIDVVTLVEHMGVKAVQSIGGQQVIIGAFDMVAGPSNLGAYVELLENKARTRDLMVLTDEVKAIAHKDGFESAFEKAQNGLISLSATGERGGFASAGEVAGDWFNRLDMLRQNPELKDLLYLPTGFSEYDRRYGGLPQGMTVLAARPGMGKTSMAITIALNAAKAGKSVLFFSLEMSKSQLMTRIISGLTKIDSRRLEASQIEDYEISYVMNAVAEIAELDFFINEQAGTLPEIKSQIEQWRLQNGKMPELVVVDYLGLIRVPDARGENAERQAIGRVVRELSTYFTSNESQLLMLCQLNRGVESRQDKRPLSSDLRDSGEIEQAAARVDMLYRDVYYNPESERPFVAELITTKNRFGTTGTIELFFESETTSFHDLAKGQDYADH